jgi:hypothetical protein
MTPDQRNRISDHADHYKFCFVIDGRFHSKHNERRMERFIADKRPKEYVFVRLTADTTYVFWNPSQKENSCHAERSETY